MKHLLAVGAIAFSVLLGPGCGRAPDHNGQDLSFAKDMVPHHQQAATMADLATTQTTNRQVLDLANRIKAAQEPEIATMNGWLSSWKERSGGPATGEMAANDGMVSAADLRTMGAANGAEFDRLFLQRMTSHHQGGLKMARIEQVEGKFPAAKALAQEIATNQEKEVAEMAKLLSAPVAAP